MLQDILLEWGASETTPMEVYTDIFKLGEGYIQRSDEEKGQFKANPVGYYRNKGEEAGHFRVFFEDKFEETLKVLQDADEFSILNGITYFGRRNIQKHASKMFALIFDLDGITDKTLNAFLSGAIVGGAYPVPNYVALSGHGVHLYYVFDEPVSLFPYTKIQLKELKYALTDKMWNRYTSTEEKVQHQGINQGFRVLGGRTKEGAPEPRVRVFRLNTHPLDLEHLCEFVPMQQRIDEKKLWQESKYSLEQAKDKFPEWYEKVIVNGDKSREYWDIAGKVNGDNPYALYDWWKRELEHGASYGHRYFSIMALAIYGVKNGKTFEDVREDALALIPFMNALNPDEPFTEADCEAALECYDERYKTFPRKDIERITGIPIPPNDRNYRKRKDHLWAETWIGDKGRPAVNQCKQNRELALTFMRENGEIKGRPKGSGTAKDKVLAYRAEHPDATVTEVARALGISRPTVYKWWAGEPAPAPEPQRRVVKAPKVANHQNLVLQQTPEDAAWAAAAHEWLNRLLELPPEVREKVLNELTREK